MNREALADLAWFAGANYGFEAILKTGMAQIIAAPLRRAAMTRTTVVSTGCTSRR